MVKPDGVKRGLVGQIIQRFEQKGYKLAAMKLLKPSKNLLEQHYAEHKEKHFFQSLINYMNSGSVVAMVWEGREIVKVGRQILGSTDPVQALPGTIRGDFGNSKTENICHGSDTVDNAKREIQLWFDGNEVF